MFLRSAWRVCISWRSRVSLYKAALSHIGISTTTSQLTIRKLRGLACWHEGKQRFPLRTAISVEAAASPSVSQTYLGELPRSRTTKSPRPVSSCLPSSHHSCGAGLDEVHRQVHPAATEIGPPEQIDDDEALSARTRMDVRGYRVGARDGGMGGGRSSFPAPPVIGFLLTVGSSVLCGASMSLSPCQDAPSFEFFSRSPARPLHSTQGRG
jgi:hypothetical protein